MKFRTATGATLETKNEEVIAQMQKAGYEVINDEPKRKPVEKTEKSDK